MARKMPGLQDISADEKKASFWYKDSVYSGGSVSVSQTSLSAEPGNDESRYHLAYHDKNAIDAVFSPDGKTIAHQRSTRFFRAECRAKHCSTRQMANSFDVQAYIMDLDHRKRPNRSPGNFNPSISSGVWSKVDGRIYFSAEDKDYVRHLCPTIQSGKKFQALSVSPDVIVAF